LRETWMLGADERAASIASRFAISLSIVRWTLAAAGGSIKRHLIESAWRDPGELTTKLDTLGRPMRWPLMKQLYDNSLRSYKLRRLDCRGVLFRADRAEDCPALNADHSPRLARSVRQGIGNHSSDRRSHDNDAGPSAQPESCTPPERRRRAPLRQADASRAARREN